MVCAELSGWSVRFGPRAASINIIAFNVAKLFTVRLEESTRAFDAVSMSWMTFDKF
jgi:hypothetical protein